ncbi:hypothetical protein HYT84_00590 [Candidatus Micrarchaeota archaeon]|nr:hypothetical protein [Candidatus Micrarchaeota archaeon]
MALLTTVLLALMHMLATAISSPPLEAWVKTEMRELIAGFIIFIIVIGLAFGTNSLTFILTGKSDTDLSKEAITNLDKLLSHLRSPYESILKATHYIGLLSGYSYSYPVPLWYASYTYMDAPYSGLGPLSTFLHQAAQGLNNAIFLYTGLKVLLKFFTSDAFSITFLSVGLGFRVFPFTRQLGNTLIALWIGATILFPTSILIMSIMHDQVVGVNAAPKISNFNPMILKIPAGFGELCSNEWIRGFTATSEIGWGLIICLPLAITGVGFQVCWENVTEVVYPIATMAFQLAFGTLFLTQALTSSLNVEIIFRIIADFLEDVNVIIILSYIDSFVVAIITVVGTKSISTALGGEYYLVGLQRLV